MQINPMADTTKSVSVSQVSTDIWSAVLSQLSTLVDHDKLTPNSVIRHDFGASTNVYPIQSLTGKGTFTNSMSYESGNFIATTLNLNSKKIILYNSSSPSTSDISNTTITVNGTFSVVY